MPSWQLEQQTEWVAGRGAWCALEAGDTQGLHSMALQLLQGDMRGRQGLVEGTLAGTHRGPDAGVSEEALAAVGGTQVAVHRMPEGSTICAAVTHQ